MRQTTASVDYSSQWGDVVGDKTPFIYDFGAAYELDKFEYYPRDSYGSGTVERMNVYSS